MSGARQRLIELYSGGTVAAVHASESYKTLCRKHEGKHVFDRERECIERLRSNVDRYLEVRDSYRKQIEFALRLSRRIKGLDDQEAFRYIVTHSYGQDWAQDQRRYFLEKSELLAGAQDYFLSFTNRNPNTPDINQVNRNHKFLIIDSLGLRTYEEAQLSERNLLAAAIHNLLRDRQFRGFYFPEHLENNEITEEKIRDNCLLALSFVQLVQGEMFVGHDAGNWCFYEYQVASGRENPILFVQVQDSIRDADVDLDYDDWFQAFRAQDAVRLTPTRWENPADIDANHERVVATLADQIEGAFNRVCDGIP